MLLESSAIIGARRRLVMGWMSGPGTICSAQKKTSAGMEPRLSNNRPGRERVGGRPDDRTVELYSPNTVPSGSVAVRNWPPLDPSFSGCIEKVILSPGLTVLGRQPVRASEPGEPISSDHSIS